MRVDLYYLVHKAQRFQLFGFARELSRADLGDAGVRERVATEVRELVALLEDHARNEEKHVHPLFARSGGEGAAAGTAGGGAVESIEREHRALERHFAELTAVVDGGRWSEVYPATMRLIGEYLLHIDEEERAQAEVLWPRYTDEELGAVVARFKAERAPAAARADFSLMLPALSVPELARVLGGVRSSAPKEHADAMLDLARVALGAERWAQVEEVLAP
ncbi:MAG TPA: hemerythrin domain-containing protein [Polyangiaceae bacterium]|nr:hemerythrin domain-containing protein [Polyangiaceae bacterium]